MRVIYKPLGYQMRVYDISYDSNGYPMFLVRIGNQWRRLSAKHFEPCEEE